jgi:hypothetical protein
MRKTFAGIVTIAVASIVCVGWENTRVAAQVPQPAATPVVRPLVLSDGVIALGTDTAEGRQQVIVIDSKTRAMSVYHIENKTGVISLKSVRSISADLMVDEFNTDSPLPREIRAILKK